MSQVELMLQEKIERMPDHPLRVVRPAAAVQPPGDDPRVDLKELIRVMQRRRKLIMWVAAVPVLIALLYSVLATPLYTASTQILIDPRDRRIVSNEVTPETLAADGGVAVVESQLLVITSDTVLRRTIARERLDTDPEFGGAPTGLAGLMRDALATVGIGGEGGDAELKALRQLKKRIGVKRSDKAFVAEVYVTSEGREKSVRIADAVAQAYLDDQTESRANAAGRASAALGGRLDALRTRVQEAEDRVVQYKEKHKLVAAGNVLVSDQQLSEMTVQLNAARGKTAEARSRYDQIVRARQSGVESGAIPEAVLSQTIGQLRTQYAEVARQRAELGALVGPRHPSITNLDAQIQGVQKLINEELARIATAARSDLERTQASERALEADLEALKQRAVTTSQASVRLRELEREADASRAVYQAFLSRARETGEQQSIDNTNARVISKATPPRDKSWPPRLLLLAVALVGGLGIGTGAGLMREYFDEGVYSRRMLAGLTGLPVLAVTPALTRRLSRWAMLSGSVRGRMRLADEGDAQSQTELMIGAMRRMRDGLFDGGRPRRRSVLVTSATSGEGRTTVALNLALIAAADGWRVLLVDADAARATLSKTLDAADNAGLFDLIEGRATLASVLLNDTDTGLSFLPLGNATRAESRNANPQEIAGKLIGPDVDLVVIDGSPMLADDAMRPFAELADDIVFVVRAGGPKRDDIAAGIEALRQNVGKLRGTVLAGAPADA
ncbi:MAG TPA: exopolysaccharide transport family protein [Xanthobacteraceae bacterium]|nr:exopolysaccharide transport family protein [Xanthobacteraceae bacterium]